MPASACRRLALELLARREHSRVELERKLQARAYSAEIIAATLRELEGSGLLDNARFIDSFVRSRVARGHGPVRIVRDLCQRGIPTSESADAVAPEAVDWAEQARRVMVKKFGDRPAANYTDRARRARFLQYRGFDSGQINAALSVAADAD